MPFNAQQTRVGVTGHIYVAAVGATAPTTSASAMPAGWTDVGYTSKKGVDVTYGIKFTAIEGWQSLLPFRYVPTGLEFTFDFELEQWNSTTLPFFFGTGTTVPVTNTNESGGETFGISNNPSVDERAICVEFDDGAQTYRAYIPRGLATNRSKFNLSRQNEAMLPVQYAALAVDGNTNLVTWLFKDANWS